MTSRTINLLVLAAVLASVRASLPFQSPAQAPLQAGEDSSTTTGAPASPVWQCDLAAWVAAPDLSPNTVIPGTARLVANGTDCRRDIVGWGIGLYFKERAVIKLKKRGAHFPREPWSENATAGFDPLQSVQHGGIDERVDEFMGDMSILENYRREMLNSSLWDIFGVERAVFDTTQELPWNKDMWLDDEWLHAVQPFAVHVPNTNFPALTNGPDEWRGSFDEWMGITDFEDACKYRLLVTLANGTVLHVPAGQTGFVPRPEPIALAPREPVWPKELALKPRRGGKNQVRSGRFGPYSEPPQCDKDSLAEFSVTVDRASSEPIIQGKTVSLKVTLHRTGNGSEVPEAMYFYHMTRHNLTWAREQVDSDAEYDELSIGYNVPPPYWAITGGPERMRMTPGEKPARIPNCPRHPSSTVYRFDNTTDLTAERIEFEVELPIGPNDMISFERSFVTHQSTLEMSLLTKYTCDQGDGGARQSAPGSVSPAEAAVRAASKSWMQHITRPEPDFFGRLNDPHLAHHGYVALDAASALPPTTPVPLHYRDPRALGPKITLSADEGDSVEYTPLGSVRPEQKDELQLKRYDKRGSRRRLCDTQGQSPGYRHACGGEWQYVGRVWARQQALDRGEDVYVPLDEREYHRRS